MIFINIFFQTTLQSKIKSIWCARKKKKRQQKGNKLGGKKEKGFVFLVKVKFINNHLNQLQLCLHAVIVQIYPPLFFRDLSRASWSWLISKLDGKMQQRSQARVFWRQIAETSNDWWAGQGEGWGNGVGRGDSSFRMWCLFRLPVASFGLAFTHSSRTCSYCLASCRSLGSCSCK